MSRPDESAPATLRDNLLLKRGAIRGGFIIGAASEPSRTGSGELRERAKNRISDERWLGANGCERAGSAEYKLAPLERASKWAKSLPD